MFNVNKAKMRRWSINGRLVDPNETRFTITQNTAEHSLPNSKVDEIG
jgi:hypothetical protein